MAACPWLCLHTCQLQAALHGVILAVISHCEQAGAPEGRVAVSFEHRRLGRLGELYASCSATIEQQVWARAGKKTAVAVAAGALQVQSTLTLHTRELLPQQGCECADVVHAARGELVASALQGAVPVVLHGIVRPVQARKRLG